jgi:hypothetical protein
VGGGIFLKVLFWGVGYGGYFVVDICRYLLQQGVKKKKIKTALRLYNM